MSTVRRPSAHRAYIREVSKQTTVMRLQGTTQSIVLVARQLINFVVRISILWHYRSCRRNDEDGR